MRSKSKQTGITEDQAFILIVDDDDGVSALIENRLRVNGFRTHRTCDGTETLKWLSCNKPDLLLLDHKLPDMTGKEVIEQLAIRVPFIIVSAQGGERFIVEMMKFGALDYIVKDTAFLDLLPSVVNHALEQVKQSVELAKREEALRNSEQRYRSVTQSAIDAIISADSNGNIVSWNYGGRKIFGYTEEEIIGKPITILMPEKYAEAHQAAVDRIRSGGDACLIGRTLELCGRRKDGSEFPLALSLSSWKSGEEEFYTGIIRDITEQKQNEEQVAELARFPAENPNPVLRAAGDGIVTYCNKAGASLLESWSCQQGEILPEYWNQFVLAALKSQLPQQIEADCGAKTFTLTFAPIPESNYVNIYGYDITERKQAEERLKSHEKRLEILLQLNRMAKAPQKDIVAFVRNKAIEITQSEFSFIGFLSEDESIMTVDSWSKGTMAQCAVMDKPMHFPIAQAGLWAEPVKQRKPIVINDYNAYKPGKKGVPEGHVPINRFLSIPVFEGDRIVAVAAVANKKNDYDEADILAFTSMMNDMWRLVRYNQAEDALVEAEEEIRKFKTIADNANYGVAISDHDGIYMYVNKYFAQVHGYSVDEVIGQSMTLFHNKEQLPQVLERFQRLKKTGSLSAKESWHCRKDGAIFPVLVNGITIKDEDGKPLFIATTTIDISERKWASEEVERLAKFPDQNPSPVLRISANGLVIYTNKASSPLLKAWQCQQGELVPAKWKKCVRDTLSSNKTQRAEVVCGRRVFSLVFAPIVESEYVNVYAHDVTDRQRARKELDKINKELEARVKQRTAQLQRIVSDLQGEVTERIKAERMILDDQKQLRQLTSELLLIEEKERRKIATGLHDSIGQILAFSSIELANFIKSASPKQARPLAHVRKMIEQAIAEIRTLTFDLSPTVLYTFGLEAAVEHLAEQFSEEHGFQCHFDSCMQDKPISDEVQILLYRSVRELLVNIAKHARANNVNVDLSRSNDHFQIKIEDDGVGFDISKLHSSSKKRNRFGLLSVRERLSHFDGSFDIQSDPGKGTKVKLLVPLER